MRIVLDGMGSDQFPEPEIQAALEAAELFGEEIILTGNQELLEPRLKAKNTKKIPVRIEHAPDAVEMSDHAVESVSRKPLNSMAVGLELVRKGEADAFITAGNSGAAMFHAVKILRRMQGIIRPAMVTTIPTKNGRCTFMDTGANADCRPEFLLEFGVMASIYAEKVVGISNPRLGLLSNGEEAGKGNQLVRDAYPVLAASGLNFIGNVEPKELFGGHADVVVADGFTGNIFIKTSEAVAKFITDLLREEISASILRKVGYMLAKPAFAILKKKMDPAEIGAAMLMGVNGYVFIGHGRSDSRALVSAIRLARQAVQNQIVETLPGAIQERLPKPQEQ
ncbi:MAG: phosphate acyltransferase PlsX [Anaerolineaceae bacterium]|nr:phosphate acyltransferase PlsX [Anaerolineaceae bacterium]